MLPSPAWKMLLIVSPYFCADFADVPQRRRDLRARHDAILHVIRRAHPAHRAERVLAALPQQIPLFGRSRDTKFAWRGRRGKRRESAPPAPPPLP